MKTAEEIVRASIVQDFSLDEKRRHLAFDFCVPYLIDDGRNMIAVLQLCAIVEQWFKDGVTPSPKLKVVSDEK